VFEIIFMVAEYIKFENTGHQEASLPLNCPTKLSLRDTYECLKVVARCSITFQLNIDSYKSIKELYLNIINKKMLW
jgi:hypothetical protein